MKSIVKKSLIYFTAGVIGLNLSSCKKDFEKINSDPNSPSLVNNGFLLTGAQKGLMDNNWDHWWGGQVGNQLAQFWASNQYSSESRYQFRTGITNSYWNLFYAGGANDAGIATGGLKELQTIIDNCESDVNKYSIYGFPANQIAVAKILQAWQMQLITDAWGDAPFSEAFKKAANPVPKFDKQRDIYLALIDQVDAALAGIDEGEDGPAGDVVYGGDMAAWRKFGNSVKLKLAMRIADREPTLASTKVNEAVTDGVFTSNADNAMFNYIGGVTGGNLHWYDYDQEGRNDFCSSNTMVDYLAGISDPRMEKYFAPTDNTGTFVGEVYGLSEANAAGTDDGDVSQRNPDLLTATAPGTYMQYAEVAFFLAEAVERGFIGGSAASYYDAGIAASFDHWGAGSPSASYMAAVDYATLKAGGKTWKQVIGAQKWIALYMQGIEGWTEWRRLDFGILNLPADGNLDGTGIPKRLKYPVDEQTLNGTNYSAAIANQGADNLDTRVWWDMN